jgi:hypothetical protein
MKDNDFTKIHDAMVNTFNDALTMIEKDDIKTFDQASINTQITKPVLLLEAVEMQTAEIKGSAGQVWLNVQYQAHCILSRAVPNVAIECINFSSLVLKTVHQNKWGLNTVGNPEQLTAFPGRYSSEPQGFDSWVVSWWQTVAIGESWALPAPGPDGIFISEAPNIGKDHENDYEELNDGFINITTP